MLVFFDTEFSGLYKGAELISVGMIDENNRRFYAEIEWLDVEKYDNWIHENVLKNTIVYGNLLPSDIIDDQTEYYRGNIEYIKHKLIEWLSKYNEIQLVSDVCHYDMVLFIDIFGKAFDLPDFVCPCCHDINQDIAKWESISDKEAFDYSREDFLKTYGINIEGAKHNSLYDAKVIKEIYEITSGR